MGVADAKSTNANKQETESSSARRSKSARSRRDAQRGKNGGKNRIVEFTMHFPSIHRGRLSDSQLRGAAQLSQGSEL